MLAPYFNINGLLIFALMKLENCFYSIYLKLNFNVTVIYKDNKSKFVLVQVAIILKLAESIIISYSEFV